MARLASTVSDVVIVELVLARHTVLVFVSATLTVETALTLNTKELFVLDGAAVRFVEIFSKSHCIEIGGVGGRRDAQRKRSVNNSVPRRRASSEGSSGGREERGQRNGLEGRARGGREESLLQEIEL